MMLENYAVMNYGGFAKILKKHDKNSPFSTQEKYLRKNVNPCSFVTYSRLKDAIKIVEKSFAVLLNLSGQINGRSQEENLKQKVSNDVFNGDMKVSNSAKIHHEFRKKNNTGNHPRARLSTADREKLERLAAISGVASSPESTAKDGKDSSADDDEEVPPTPLPSSIPFCSGTAAATALATSCTIVGRNRLPCLFSKKCLAAMDKIG